MLHVSVFSFFSFLFATLGAKETEELTVKEQ